MPDCPICGNYLSLSLNGDGGATMVCLNNGDHFYQEEA